MAKYIDPRVTLAKWVKAHGTQHAAAKALGVSTSLVNEMLGGTRNITPVVLEQLGLRRVVVKARRSA